MARGDARADVFWTMKIAGHQWRLQLPFQSRHNAVGFVREGDAEGIYQFAEAQTMPRGA